MKNIGIQINSNYDLAVQVRRDGMGKIVSGLMVGDVTYQNQATLLLAQKGELKENPTSGVGINDMCNDSDFRLWEREITRQIEADGQQIEKLAINSNGMILEARY
jgi:hypothetical protein